MQLSDDLAAIAFSTEHFVHLRFLVDATEREDDLFAGLRGADIQK